MRVKFLFVLGAIILDVLCLDGVNAAHCRYSCSGDSRTWPVERLPQGFRPIRSICRILRRMCCSTTVHLWRNGDSLARIQHSAESVVEG
jgi:hypothetical protein